MKRPIPITGALFACLLTACGGNSTTSPSTTTTATVAAASVTESWTGTVQPAGFKFYSFAVAENGTVNLTLTSVSGTYVPSSVMLGLGLGQPAGTDCVTTQS